MFLLGHIGITIGIFFILGYLRPEIRIRYWYVGLGAILPDIIDKLIGRVLFSESIANGRIIAHTIIFSLFLFLIGFYLYRRSKDARILYMSGAAFIHIIEDRMWSLPQIFFWPLYGWKFPHGTQENSWIDYFLDIFRNSVTPVLSLDFISEVVGIIIVIFIAIFIKRRKKY
jgi:membrane-bound metal-dependent hydrolase YbcI (DUF457 family)